MDDLLFLAHRIPYPPNKGDKIRSWHILRHLAERYRVHLGCFVDDEDDWQHTGFLNDVCETTHFARLNPKTAQIRSVSAFLTNEPLSVAYYRDRGLSTWVRETAGRVHPSAVFLYSSQTARFLTDMGPGGQRRVVMDFVDVDSDKWAQYAAARSGPMGALYRREASRLAAFEKKVAARVDASLFVSPKEAALFRTFERIDGDKVFALTNGVDCEKFDPAGDYPNPFPAGEKPIVFTGAMDYWPNVDAVCWFADEVLPAVQAEVPEAVFYIVGWKPAREVMDLASRPGVVVTGAVDETRDYLAHAAVAVAPLRVARGIQNKVLEAMSMAMPVVASEEAAEGLDLVETDELAVTSSAEEMTRAVIAALTGAPGAPDGTKARARVVDSYGWAPNLRVLDDLLTG